MSLVLVAILISCLTGSLIALLLTLASKRNQPAEASVIDQINQLLPQTQCAQCGHPGCRPYAEAIANGEAINRCPPGGDQTIADLAELLGLETLPLDENFGEPAPPRVAVIREAECIGCTLCIQACPVDAILGAQGQMHVILESACTGCDLCVPPCPVDCIDMIEVPVPPMNLVEIPPARPGSPVSSCIRCGDCETVCPRDLQPQELFWRRGNSEMMSTLKLDACVECRLCDRACPSDIPLTQAFVETKERIRVEQALDVAARRAEARYEQHQARLQADRERIRSRPDRADKAALLARLKRS